MRLRKYFGDKAFYAMVLAVFMPMLIQQGITTFVNLLDNIMVGRLGTEQMTGVSIANQLITIFNMCVFGGLSGIGVFSAQYFGQQNDEGARYTFRLKLWLCLILLAIFIGLFTTFGRELVMLFLSDSSDFRGDINAACDAGVTYLRYMIVGMIPYAIVQIYASTLREAKYTMLPMVAGFIAVFVNLIGNYFLIFGNFGAPKLGIRGAAIATIASRFVELTLIVVYSWKKREKLPFLKGLYRSMRVPLSLIRSIAFPALSLLFNEFLWSTSMTLIMQNFSKLGVPTIAAYNIQQTVSTFFSIFIFAAGASIGIFAGQHLGAGRIEEAKDTTRKLIVFGLMCDIVMAAILACFAGLIPQLYNVEPNVRELARMMLLVLAVVMPIDGFNASCYYAIRCGGKMLLTILFDSVYAAAVTVPLSWLLVTFTDLTTPNIFFIVMFSNIIKSFIGYFIVKRGSWAQNIVNQIDLGEASKDESASISE